MQTKKAQSVKLRHLSHCQSYAIDKMKKKLQILKYQKQLFSVQQSKITDLCLNNNQEDYLYKSKRRSLPYSAYSLCYFEKQFQQKESAKKKKIPEFNSNAQIRSFLNSKLKEYSFNPSYPPYLESKQSQRLKSLKNSPVKKINNFTQGQNGNDVKNDSTLQNKSQKINSKQNVKFLTISKIKSKKEYFLTKFKKMIPINKTQIISGIIGKKKKTHYQNYSQIQFHYKTADQSKMSNFVNKSKKYLKLKKISSQQYQQHHSKIKINEEEQILQKKQQNIEDQQIKIDKLDPWQSFPNAMQNSLKFSQN